jgi:alkylation response protein AidB-like acyl-CoA dehydrogenase
MKFATNDDQRQLADSLQRFLADANRFEVLRTRLSASPPERLALWPRLAEMGVIGAAFDEAHGGFAGDARTIAIVMNLLGRSLVVDPYLSCAVVCGRILQRCVSPSAAAWTDAVIAGREIFSLAHSAGADPFACPSVAAWELGGQVSLSGGAACVRNADVAGRFLVTAVRDGHTQIFCVPAAAQGLSVQTYRLIDGSGAGDLRFDGVTVAADAQLIFDADARGVLTEALEWGIVGLVAATAGIVDALNKATFEYLVTRKQFGAAIGTNQALQHRAADMHVAGEEISAAVDAAIESMTASPSAGRSAAVSAAKIMADTAARRVGHEAIQLHGGMGVSDELNVSHYARRLAAMRAELGSADVHRLRLEDSMSSQALRWSPEAFDDGDDWRRQVRDFVSTRLPLDLARKVEQGLKLEKDDYVRWQKILHEHGWFAGAWPVEYGGQGWDLGKQLIFAQESALCNAPMIIPYGVNMVGPVLYTFGTAAQKAEHLPGILASDVWWCQGYSEPGAGSDLASLKTFAARDGGHYIVNGTKMWTTEAHWADKMHCLVRTDASGKPQQGITFLLIDMYSPGITVQPIVTIDGLHHTNQIFFDDVRVPMANRVGEEGAGWGIAKFLLGNERTSIADTGSRLRLLRHIRAQYQAFVADATVGASLKALLSARLADLEVQLWTLVNLEARYVRAWQGGRKMGAEASILKVRGTEILQSLTELALDLEGEMAAAHDPKDLYLRSDTTLAPSQRASLVAHDYLYGRCWSIFGGTNEVQRNIIARAILGTP